MQTLTFNTQGNNEVRDISNEVTTRLPNDADGIVHLFITHTTAALSAADLDPGTDKDMSDAFEAMIPDLDYRHPHDPSHVGDHIMATIIGPSVSIPVKSGELVLGTWQHIVLIEFDGPRERTVTMSILAEQ